MPTLLHLGDAQHVDTTRVIGIDLPYATNMPAEGIATILTTVSSATAVAATAAATATAAASPNSPHSNDNAPEGECQLVGSFALFVQATLGALALLSLVYKRYRERPQRPLKIWFFDVSKQVFGSGLVHVANIFMSMLTSGKFSIKLDSNAATAATKIRSDSSYVPNPCSLYLLNLGIDTTFGIPILIILLKIITGIVAFTPLGKPSESIQSGHYGHPPNASWWLKQSVIYFCGLFGMKICVLLIFVLMPWISKVGDWALGWTEGNEKLQIAFVMMIFPLVMNGLQYYIIDSLIKEKEPYHERLASDESDHDRLEGYRTRLQAPDEDDDGDSSGASDLDHDSHAARAKMLRTSVEEEYDPDVDGHAQTVTGGNGSLHEHLRRTRVLPQELFPKE
ncbi:hypothetical protein E4U17_005001 [Claviceps sp. LM77 group G4]|nr:hypothetical protein E4U17_005001 [Claviceps sp. LM77 group G4]KAG6064733.1 hypothetical protein E4U33_006048 [Claviceps sp. LM78 group G4]KAG6070670.1 hypothetical protein E4U16_006687 [Claviceps sp. LM84 group G4]